MAVRNPSWLYAAPRDATPRDCTQPLVTVRSGSWHAAEIQMFPTHAGIINF